jgi:hypothetical protein
VQSDIFFASIAAMTETLEDTLRDRALAYMRRHKLTAPAMARHTGIPVDTLKSLLYGQTRSCRAATREAIEAAISASPPDRPPPKHGARIAELWDRLSSDAIGADLGISGALVRRIAASMGLSRNRRAENGRTERVGR